jgi:hypothetical protein
MSLALVSKLPGTGLLDHDVVGMLIRFDINEQISAANDDQVLDDVR